MFKFGWIQCLGDRSIWNYAAQFMEKTVGNEIGI